MKKKNGLKSRKEIRAEKKKLSGKTDIDAANEKKSSSSGASEFFGKLKKFLKRYWYWPVTLVVLAAGVVGWCLALDYSENNSFVDVSPENISIYVNSYCNLAPKLNGNQDANINFYVEEGYESILSVNSNGLVFAKSEGEGKVIAQYGKHKKTYYITSVTYSAIWVLGVGDRITRDDIYEGLGSNLIASVDAHMVETYSNNADEEDEIDELVDVLEKKESAYDDWWYEVVHEGICDIKLFVDGTLTCIAKIYAYNDIDDTQRQFNREIPLFSVNEDLPTDNLNGTKELYIDDKLEITPGEFSLSGPVFYYSSNPDVLKLSQDGKMIAYAGGDTFLSIICVDSDNNIELQTYKITISPQNIYFWKGKEDNKDEVKDILIGEIISEEDLKAFFYSSRVDNFRADEKVFERTVKSDGIYFEVKDYPSGGKEYGEIYAIDEDGIVLAVYNVFISEESSEESEEEA